MYVPNYFICSRPATNYHLMKYPMIHYSQHHCEPPACYMGSVGDGDTHNVSTTTCPNSPPGMIEQHDGKRMGTMIIMSGMEMTMLQQCNSNKKRHSDGTTQW